MIAGLAPTNQLYLGNRQQHCRKRPDSQRAAIPERAFLVALEKLRPTKLLEKNRLMKDDTSSITAEATLVFRAVESRRPPKTRIANDYVAPLFLPRHATVLGRTKIPEPIARWIYNLGFPGIEAYILTRSRFFDDCFSSSLDDGVTQLVLLGAGYDSRAYRFASRNPDCRVFEVDHPATQNIKKELVRRIFGEIPSCVRYVPINFQRESLEHVLPQSGFTANAQTLFLWEGVTYYIRAEAIDAILGFVANHSAEGSQVVFDYIHPDVVEGRSWRREAIMMKKIVEQRGEPLFFGLACDSLQSFLSNRGFCKIHNHDPRSLYAQYVTKRTIRRKPSPIFSIARARVC